LESLLLNLGSARIRSSMASIQMHNPCRQTWPAVEKQHMRPKGRLIHQIPFMLLTTYLEGDNVESGQQGCQEDLAQIVVSGGWRGWALDRAVSLRRQDYMED
jgi:hypothetical protein